MKAPAQLIQLNQLPCVHHADYHLIQTFQHTLCLLRSKFWQWQYSYGKPHVTLISGVNSMKGVEFLTAQDTQNDISYCTVHSKWYHTRKCTSAVSVGARWKCWVYNDHKFCINIA